MNTILAVIVVLIISYVSPTHPTFLEVILILSIFKMSFDVTDLKKGKQ